MTSIIYFSKRIFLFLLLTYGAYGFNFLSPNFYSTACPNLQRIVRATMKEAIAKDPTKGAAMLCLFFHDCFVNGCDASVLLDHARIMVGEKNAPANKNSLRGFEVIDKIKARVEASCPRMLRGPRWEVLLGRSDSTSASIIGALTNFPSPSANVSFLIGIFAANLLTPKDMVALSGAHTIGRRRSRCSIFRDHIYHGSNIASEFATKRQATCPIVGGDDTWTPLDEQTPNRFDNEYFKNLVTGHGLLHSDQELFSGKMTDMLVRQYSNNNSAFAKDFARAMVKLGNIMPVMGSIGEVRLNCRKVN